MIKDYINKRNICFFEILCKIHKVRRSEIIYLSNIEKQSYRATKTKTFHIIYKDEDKAVSQAWKEAALHLFSKARLTRIPDDDVLEKVGVRHIGYYRVVNVKVVSCRLIQKVWIFGSWKNKIYTKHTQNLKICRQLEYKLNNTNCE